MSSRCNDAGQKELPPVILLIEHDEDDVFFFRRALSRLEFQCDLRVCESWEAAKLWLENSQPDLIVSDFQFRHYTALEHVRGLRSTAKHAGIPLVVWSGVASGIDTAAFEGLNVSRFVRKGVDFGEVSESLLPMLRQVARGS